MALALLLAASLVPSAEVPAKLSLHIDPATPGARVFAAEQVRQRTVAESVVALGRVERDEQSVKVVVSPVSGRVSRILVSAGARVHKGQGLAELASAEVEAARSAAIQAESDLDAARRALEQIQFDASSVSSQSVDQARADLKRAQAQLDRTRKTLSALGVDPRAFTSLYLIRSPADGTVLDVPAAAGEELRPGDRAVRLGDAHHWTVVFQARSKDPGVQLNEPVDIAVEGHSEPLRGKIRQIDAPEVSGAVRAVVAVDDPGTLLRAGVEVQVKLGHSTTSEILSVPASALLFVEGGVAVVVASGSLDLELRPVEIGPIDGPSVRVTSGLKSDEKVLIRGGVFAKAALEHR